MAGLNIFYGQFLDTNGIQVETEPMNLVSTFPNLLVIFLLLTRILTRCSRIPRNWNSLDPVMMLVSWNYLERNRKANH